MISKYPWSTIPVRYLAVYLIYLSTAVRVIALYEGRPERAAAALLLLAYGALLFLEPRLTRRLGGRPWIYLLLQFGLTIGLQSIPPRLEVVATLFVPLSLQAVLLLGRRKGVLWIGGFTLAIAGPVMSSFDSALPGLAMVVFYGGVFLLIGQYAHVIQSADSARGENERLMDELRLARAQLQAYAARMEEQSVAEERRRMAREVHDSVTQTLFSMNLAAQTASMLIQRDPARVSEQLDRLQELARGATGEIRVLTNEMTPARLTEQGMVAALHRLVAAFRRREGLEVRLEVTGDRDLPERIVANLSRIAQEALNNVAKHAGTREAEVRMNMAGERAWLEVEDGGAGFDPGLVAARGERTGVGLRGMSERAAEVGWKLSVYSAPGRGTRIRAEES